MGNIRRIRFEDHKQVALRRQLRSAVTNGQRFFASVDHRSSNARRFRDILHSLTDALGGNAVLSPQEKALVWKVSIFQLWTELIEARWFRQESDDPPSYEIFKTHTRAVNSMRRIYNDLGLKKRAQSPKTLMTKTEAEEYLSARGIVLDLDIGEMLDAAE